MASWRRVQPSSIWTFFEALGLHHYRGSPVADDKRLRELYIDRIYDTCTDEEQLEICDNTIKEIADHLEGRPYSSREFIREMGADLNTTAKKEDSLVLAAYGRMAFAEATSVLPLIASYVYHKRLWQDTPQRQGSRIFKPMLAGERK